MMWIEVSEEDAGQRLDNFLFRTFKDIPKSRIYRGIRSGELRINGGRTQAPYKLQCKDKIRIPPPWTAASSEDGAPSRFPCVSERLSQELRRRVLFEDERLLAIDKPSGLPSHGGHEAPLGLIEASRLIWGLPLELVHRLDKETSGVVLIAKKRSMLRSLHALFREGAVRKRYRSILTGALRSPQRVIDAPLLKQALQTGGRFVCVDAEGLPSKTLFKRLVISQEASLVDVFPETGRTHQIRVHAMHMGHPIMADDRYGARERVQADRKQGARRLCLHAAALSFTLEGVPYHIEAPWPEDLAELEKKFFSEQAEGGHPLSSSDAVPLPRLESF